MGAISRRGRFAAKAKAEKVKPEKEEVVPKAKAKKVPAKKSPAKKSPKKEEPAKEEGFRIDTKGGTPWNGDTSFPTGVNDWETQPEAPAEPAEGDAPAAKGKPAEPPAEDAPVEPPKTHESVPDGLGSPDLLPRVDAFQNALEEAKADGRIDPGEVMGLLGNMMEMVQLLVHAEAPKEPKEPVEPKVAMYSRRALVFDTKKEKEDYLKDHDVDKGTKLEVKENGKGKAKAKPKKDDKGKAKPKKDDKGNGKKKDDPAVLDKVLKDSDPEAVERFRHELPDYRLTLVARKDGKLDQADIENVKDIQGKLKWMADRLEKGIKDSADICEMKPEVCEGNMGLTRNHMPQIMDSSVKSLLESDDPKDQKKGQAAVDAGADPEDDRPVLNQLMSTVQGEGTEITENVKIPVGKLKATQSEIKAGKTYGIANAFLDGSLDDKVMGNPIIATSDGHILDGHHRYSAALTVDPDFEMNVTVIDMPMREFLLRAHEQPGVFRADIDDNIISDDEPVDLATPPDSSPQKIKRRGAEKKAPAKPKAKGKPKKASLDDRVASHQLMVMRIAKDVVGRINYDFLADQLSNAMEMTEREFVGMAKQFGLSRSDAKTVFEAYWDMPVMNRSRMNRVSDWKKWVDGVI